MVKSSSMVFQATDFQVNGVLLRAIRESCRWSRNALAKEVGIHSTHLLRVERGERELSKAVAQRIAGVLGVPIKVFYNTTNEEGSAVA